jgi:hypothetical protein
MQSGFLSAFDLSHQEVIQQGSCGERRAKKGKDAVKGAGASCRELTNFILVIFRALIDELLF